MMKHVPILAMTLSLILASDAAVRAADFKRPNIILCMADDQGWGDVGFRDHRVLKTPVLDEMAATGLRLDRFYAAAPVCSPTRGSVLTGRHPNRFGCFTWGHSLRPQEITVAEALKTAGYATGHFGKWHLGSMRADSPISPGGSGFDRWLSTPNFYENNPLMSRNGKVVQMQGESSRVIVDASLDFIGECVKKEQPFLAVVWFGSPHGPHIASEEFRKPYRHLPKRLQHFYGELAGIDAAMGHLRKEIRKLGIADNTLLWYTSDNGALAVGSTGGLSGRKGNLYEGGLRVPSMLEWPDRIKKPRLSKVVSGTVDIYPTLLEIAGVTVPRQPPLDGQSLIPLIDGAMKQRDKPLGFWTYPARGVPMRSTQMLQQQAKEQKAGAKPSKPAADPGKIVKRYPLDQFPGNAAWMDGDYKLHRRTGKGKAVNYLLFNLGQDPSEKNNLVKEQPKRFEQMKTQLRTWQQSVIKSLNGEDYRDSP